MEIIYRGSFIAPEKLANSQSSKFMRVITSTFLGSGFIPFWYHVPEERYFERPRHQFIVAEFAVFFSCSLDKVIKCDIIVTAIFLEPIQIGNIWNQEDVLDKTENFWTLLSGISHFTYIGNLLKWCPKQTNEDRKVLWLLIDLHLSISGLYIDCGKLLSPIWSRGLHLQMRVLQSGFFWLYSSALGSGIT